MGYLDIETSNLSGDFGVVLSYCIKYDNGEIISRVLSPQEIKEGIYDKKLLTQLCVDIKKFTRVIGYYSSRFDIPFLRTRCLYWNLDFPKFRELKHTDAYLIVKSRLNLHSKRLGVVAPFLHIPAKEHPLNPAVWFRCMSGNKRALAFVLTHNKEDVISLEKLWHKIKDYCALNNTSI